MHRGPHFSHCLALAPALFLGILLTGCADRGAPTALTAEGKIQASSHVAQAKYRAHLSGAEMVPPVETLARGQAKVEVSADRTEVWYRLNVSNLHEVVSAHIQRGAEGVNGPQVVELYSGPIQGHFSGVLATGVFTAADLIGQWAGEPLETLLEALETEGLYVIVRTEAYPAGEIRGQIR